MKVDGAYRRRDERNPKGLLKESDADLQGDREQLPHALPLEEGGVRGRVFVRLRQYARPRSHDLYC